MKILYIGPTGAHALGWHYVHAFKNLGAEVCAIDPKLFETNGLISRLIVHGSKKPMNSRVEVAEIRIVTRCRREKFDLIFVMAENFLTSLWMEEIRDGLGKGAPVFVYHSHDNNFSKGILKPNDFWERLSYYDFVFTTKAQNVARYKTLGVVNTFFIASAYSPGHHHPIEKSKYHKDQFPVTFVGTYDRSREPYLNAIDVHQLHVWGNGWRRYRQYRKRKSNIRPVAVYNEEFSDIVCHSQINLGLLREEAEDFHTTRTFEIPASGGLQLAPRTDEILSFFQEDKEIVCFGSVEEMNEKIAFLLQAPKVRHHISRAGYERCINGKHTYLDRASEILQVISRETSGKIRSAA